MRGDASKLENTVLKDNIRHKLYKQLMDKTKYFPNDEMKLTTADLCRHLWTHSNNNQS